MKQGIRGHGKIELKKKASNETPEIDRENEELRRKPARITKNKKKSHIKH